MLYVFITIDLNRKEYKRKGKRKTFSEELFETHRLLKCLEGFRQIFVECLENYCFRYSRKISMKQILI